MLLLACSLKSREMGTDFPVCRSLLPFTHDPMQEAFQTISGIDNICERGLKRTNTDSLEQQTLDLLLPSEHMHTDQNETF